MPRQSRALLAADAVDDLRRLIRVFRISARRAERQLGISGAQLFVLQQLAKGPAQSLNQLADRTLTHQSSVSVVVRRLVERGLVARERSLYDARRIELRLTPAGAQLLRSAPAIPQIRFVETVRALPLRDLKALARLLQRLVEGVGGRRLQPAMMFDEESPKRRAKRR